MQTSPRLNHALNKLYKAFHEGTLHPEYCNSCAVGTILDHTDSWKYLTDIHGSTHLNYVGLVNQNFGRKFNGYTPLELLQIEAEFLKGCGYTLPLNRQDKKPKNPIDKEVLFNGVCKTVELLCELDGISNVMDYSKLFEFENNQPKFELSEMI